MNVKTKRNPGGLIPLKKLFSLRVLFCRNATLIKKLYPECLRNVKK